MRCRCGIRGRRVARPGLPLGGGELGRCLRGGRSWQCPHFGDHPPEHADGKRETQQSGGVDEDAGGAGQLSGWPVELCWISEAFPAWVGEVFRWPRFGHGRRVKVIQRPSGSR